MESWSSFATRSLVRKESGNGLYKPLPVPGDLEEVTLGDESSVGLQRLFREESNMVLIVLTISIIKFWGTVLRKERCGLTEVCTNPQVALGTELGEDV